MLFKEVVTSSRVKLKVFGAVLLMGGLTGLRAELPNVEGTMPEDYLPDLKLILQTAMKQAPGMVLSEISGVQAEATRIAAQAALYPSLNGSLSYTISESAPSSNPAAKSKSQGLFYSASASQNLFQWGAVKNQADIAKIGELMANKYHAEAYRLLAASLRLQYMGLIVKKASLEGVNYRQKISESNLEVEEQKLKNGTISPGEIISPRLTVEEARLSVARAEQDYENSRRLFAHLAGYKEIADSAIPTEIAKPVYSADTAASLLALLKRDNAETTNAAQIALFSIRQADLSYKIARVRLLPKFSASASTSLSNSTSVVGGAVNQDAVNSQSASINGSWTIFDGFATRGAKKGALASKRYYERVLQNQIQLTLDTAENLQKTLAIGARSLDLTETRTQLAEGALNRFREEAKLGNIPPTAVDETAAAYLMSKNMLAAARAEFLSKWADFVSLVGVDPAMNNLPARYAR